MPSFTLPPLQKKDEENEIGVAVEAGSTDTQEGPNRWERTISIPVNDEILESLKVGDKVSVTLVGEVHGTNNSESKNEEYENIEKSIRVMISEVEVYPEDGEFEDEEGAMNEGYDEG